MAVAPRNVGRSVDCRDFSKLDAGPFSPDPFVIEWLSAFIFDDNTIRMNWLWATALGFVKLPIPSIETAEALEIFALAPDDEDRRRACR